MCPPVLACQIHVVFKSLVTLYTPSPGLTCCINPDYATLLPLYWLAEFLVAFTPWPPPPPIWPTGSIWLAGSIQPPPPPLAYWVYLACWVHLASLSPSPLLHLNPYFANALVGPLHVGLLSSWWLQHAND